jgi:hypothetical protein
MRACCNFNFSSGFNMGVIGLGGPTSNQAHSMQEIGVGCLKWNGGEDYNFTMETLVATRGLPCGGYSDGNSDAGTGMIFYLWLAPVSESN